MTVDPLVSLLVGALGAALLGLFGAWIQSRREHAKWLREKRFAAYLTLLQVIDSERMTPGTTNPTTFRNAASEVALTGPYALLEFSTKYLEAASKGREAGDANTDEVIDIRQDFIMAAQKALSISRRR